MGGSSRRAVCPCGCGRILHQHEAHIWYRVVVHGVAGYLAVAFLLVIAIHVLVSVPDLTVAETSDVIPFVSLAAAAWWLGTGVAGSAEARRDAVIREAHKALPGWVDRPRRRWVWRWPHRATDMIRPGPGDVSGGDAELAGENMRAFVAEVEARGGRFDEDAVPTPQKDADGRSAWLLLLVSGIGVEVLMPGVPLAEVRNGADPDAPCLRVDGEWCWWDDAVSKVAALLSEQR